MSLDTYANLKTELQDWTARADITATIDTLIDLFEAWVNRNIRHREMEAEATTSATEYIALPTDFLALRDVQYQSNPRVQLRYVTPEYADLYDPTGASGTPLYYTMVGNQLRLVPAPSSSTTVRISYWQKVPALDGDNTTNWLLESHADAYLYGPLFHGLVWAHNPTIAQYVQQGWAEVMRELRNDGKASNLGGSIQIRPA
jgi:hypothetical protein